MRASESRPSSLNACVAEKQEEDDDAVMEEGNTDFSGDEDDDL